MAKVGKPAVQNDEARARQMLEALYGPPLSTEQLRQIADHCNGGHLKKVRAQSSLSGASRKLINPIAETLSKDIGTDVAAARRRLNELADSVRAPDLPTSPKFKPALMPGSTIALFVPPFEGGFKHPNGGIAEIDESTGDFHVRSQSIGRAEPDPLTDFVQGFHPNADGWMHFKAGVQFSYSWWDTAMFYTAHTFGRIGLELIRLVPAPVVTIADDTRELWADGVGWLESHNGNNEGTLSLDIPFLAHSAEIYAIVVTCTVHTDADGGAFGISAATGDIHGRATAIAVKSS